VTDNRLMAALLLKMAKNEPEKWNFKNKFHLRNYQLFSRLNKKVELLPFLQK